VSISDRLREERQRLNLIQMDAAKAGGVGFTTYQGYERGTRFPDAEMLEKLYVAGFDVLYIVTGVRNNSTLSNEETVVLELFNKLDERGRAVMLGVAQIYNSN
jgi:transcriptional regulator with XRE-family HTH domain